MPNDSLCPMYKVSAWSVSGEGEISEPVQESTPQAPHSIAAENISVLLAAESDALRIEIEVSRLPFNLTQLNNFDLTYSSAMYGTSRISEFFLIILITPTGSINQHWPRQAVANFTISLPPSVDECPLRVWISAGNSAGMSAPSEVIEVESFTTAATTTNIMDTESGNRQEQDNTTLTVIIIGVIAGALIDAAVIVGIICCRHKRRLSKGQTDNDHSEGYTKFELIVLLSESTTTSSPSTDSEGSNDHLLQPTPPAPVESPHLVYAQVNPVKQTQVLPPANDDPVQYAQIKHQD